MNLNTIFLFLVYFVTSNLLRDYLLRLPAIGMICLRNANFLNFLDNHRCWWREIAFLHAQNCRWTALFLYHLMSKCTFNFQSAETDTFLINIDTLNILKRHFL